MPFAFPPESVFAFAGILTQHATLDRLPVRIAAASGFAIISFPTPTWLYASTRSAR
jgi:hypothetical protein